MIKRIVVNGILLATSIVIALLTTEGVLRYFRLVPRETIFTVDEHEFNLVPGIFSPNLKGVQQKNVRLAGCVSINSLGYRGPDFPIKKAEKEFRIFMTGDSFTFGDYVNDDQTFPAQLERELKKACGSIRVVNGGLGGSTISDQIELTKRALRLDPDLVIVVFSDNDFDDLRRNLWNELKQNRQRKSRFPYSIIYRTVRHSALWTLTLRARQNLQQKKDRGSTPSYTRNSEQSQHIDPRVIYGRLLAKENAILTHASIPLFFVAFPGSKTVFQNGSTKEVETAIELARELGISATDLTPFLRASGISAQRSYLLPNDGHPSAFGYHIAAAGLAKELTKFGALSKICISTPPYDK